jgi:hypothetical protein
MSWTPRRCANCGGILDYLYSYVWRCRDCWKHVYPKV